MTRFLISTVACIVAALCSISALSAEQTEDVPFEPGVRDKAVLQFPAVGEIQQSLQDTGLVEDFATVEVRCSAPEWKKLSAVQSQLQFGSLMGELAFAAIRQHNPTTARCLEALLAGSKALGVPEDSKSRQALQEVLGKVKTGTISAAQLLKVLDSLREQGLRDLADELDEEGMTVVTAAAWLRGGIVTAQQVETEDQATALAQLLAQPDLVQRIEASLADATGAEESDARYRRIASQLLELAHAEDPGREELEKFTALAEQLFS
ncbi:MAG: hypothetical protein SX243_06200 [Acidobacteriota bacterium]|nr:hypothetical protein [Acidobacteriota bacterium]